MADSNVSITLSDGATFTYPVYAIVAYSKGSVNRAAQEVASKLESANSELQKSIYPKVKELDQGIQDSNVLQGDFLGPLMSLTNDMNKDATTAYSSTAFCAITLREMGAATQAKGEEAKKKYKL